MGTGGDDMWPKESSLAAKKKKKKPQKVQAEHETIRQFCALCVSAMRHGVIPKGSGIAEHPTVLL